jgi:methyl-accepting chemotaxis protein
MIFGEEGERLAQQRAAANRQYAEDLKQQIAAKQGLPKSPVSLAPKKDTSPRRPPSLLDQAQQPNVTQPALNQRPPPRSQLSEPRRSSSPYLEPLPDLPPANTGPSPDAIRFADRLNWLESSIDQHQSVLRTASDSASRIERTSIPSLRDGIEKLQSAIDRIAQVDLPGRLRPLEDDNQRLEEKISSASTEYARNAQELRDSLGQVSSSFSQTQSRFSEFSDSIKATILEFKSEITQARDAHDAVSQRISQSEAKVAQTEESLRAVGSTLQNFEKSSTDGIANAQYQINTMVSNASLQIAQDLKLESEERDRMSAELHAKTEEVNQKAAQNVTMIQTGINDLAGSFKRSIGVLSSSVRDALETLRDQSDNRYKELSGRLDDLVGQVESNFTSVQNESVATLAALNQHAAKAREELETALTQECETRKQNELQIVQRYDNFKSLIVNEMQLQTAQMEQMSEQAKQKVVTKCNDAIIPLKNDLAALREKTRGAEQLPQKVAELERAIAELNTQLVENVGSLSQQSSGIVSSIDRIRTESEQSIDQVNERLRILEDEASKPEYVTRAEVEESFGRLNAEFDARMQEIEQQIGVVFSSLSELTMTLPAQSEVRQSAAARLEQLANPD